MGVGLVLRRFIVGGGRLGVGRGGVWLSGRRRAVGLRGLRSAVGMGRRRRAVAVAVAGRLVGVAGHGEILKGSLCSERSVIATKLMKTRQRESGTARFIYA